MPQIFTMNIFQSFRIEADKSLKLSVQGSELGLLKGRLPTSTRLPTITRLPTRTIIPSRLPTRLLTSRVRNLVS